MVLYVFFFRQVIGVYIFDVLHIAVVEEYEYKLINCVYM